MTSTCTLRIAALVLATALAQRALAQGAPPRAHDVAISGFAGYAVNGDVDTSGGLLRVDDAPAYGAAIGVELRPGTWAELTWIYSGTHAQFSSNSLAYPSSAPFKVDMHYFQAGGTVGFPNGNLVPFISGSLGAGLYLPATIDLGTGGTLTPGATWRFAFTLGGGLEYFLSKAVALRLDARLLAPVYFTSGAFYAGSGGAALAVSGGIPFVQGCFTGGLVIAP